MINYLNLTFIIVTFRSEHIIRDCIKDIPKECKIIIVENSGNYEFYKKLKDEIPNLKVLIMKENCGYGKANNFGILNSVTDYLFIINPDTKIYKAEIDKIIEIVKGVDFAIAAPQIVEKFKIYKQNNDNEDYVFVNEVPGMAMLLNKNKFSNSFFDENIFLYLENDDLCLRIKNNNEKIYIIKNSFIKHIGGISKNQDLEYLRNWHWMWSKFYFNKKHSSYVLALIRISPSFLSSILKFIFYKVFSNNIKKKCI